MSDCAHLTAVAGTPEPAPDNPDSCSDCLAEGRDDWVHLRLCLACGHVACCDSSPRRHATAHYLGAEHPVMRSFETGESWRWCYVDETIG